MKKELLYLKKIYIGDLNEDCNEWYNNIEDVKCKFNKDGYYKFKSDGDSNILIDSIEYIGIDCYVDDKKLDLDNGDWLSEGDEIYCSDGIEYIRLSMGDRNIEMIFSDNILDENCNDLNMEIVRRKDNNKIFKLCYDIGDSLCEVYKLVDGEYVDSDSEEVYE